MQNDSTSIPKLEWVEVAQNNKKKITIELQEIGPQEITLPYFISKYTVTYEQMMSFYDSDDGYGNDKWWKGLALTSKRWHQDTKKENCPAHNVNWYTAIASSRWLSSKLNKTIRLPTEAEWWYAATLGDKSKNYPWGSKWKPNHANTVETDKNRITAVDRYPDGISPCGAYDMYGNVSEWCLNEFEDPQKVSLSSGFHKAIRGSSFVDTKEITVHSRKSASAINTFSFVGFRLLMEM